MNFHNTLDTLSQLADESEIPPSTVCYCEQPLLSLTTVGLHKRVYTSRIL